MADSGTGTGTPVVISTPAELIYDTYEELDARYHCAVSLSRYAKLINIDEAGFWGVHYDDWSLTGCAIWREDERMNVAHALAEAQQDIEQVVGYPLCPTWIVGEVADEQNNDFRWVDSQQYRIRQVTRYGMLIEAGVRATTDISSGESVSHATDPAVVGPVATVATNTDEIKVYYPGSSREITPSSIVISGGNVTIQIPRYRLVKADRINNPAVGWEYDDLSHFQATVDVKREYNDPSTNAVLVRPHCENNSCSNGCNECTHAGCIYILEPRTGIVDIMPATYTNDAWTTANLSICNRYSRVRLNYRAGLQFLSTKMEMAIVRLAHSKLEDCPCDCSRTRSVWARDTKIPELLTRERLNCPFGLSQGSWIAWTMAKSMRLVRMGVL